MLIATFGPSTAWAGKTITAESEIFRLADHGPISAADVLVYAQQGHLLWADQSLQLSVETVAMADAAAINKAHHCWAEGELNVMLTTSDDGKIWHPADDLEVRTHLTGVAFADDRRGWAVSSGGHIYATTDGGVSWDVQARTEAPLHGITSTDVEHAWAVGDSGVIVATRDGRSWNQQHTAGTTLLTVAFCDRIHGWAAGLDGAILATSDAGRTWRDRSLDSDAFISAIACSDPLHVWATADEHGPCILASADGGNNWSEQRPLLVEDNQLFGIDFADPVHGWAVGDHSATWLASPEGRPVAKFTDACGIVLATVDGGRTWESQITWGVEWLRAVAACDVKHAWAVGPRGAIETTRDGGATWESQESGCHEYLIDVACTDTHHAWAVGEGLVVTVTADGGSTWHRRHVCGARPFATEFSRPSCGWAVGNSGVLATMDGGSSWHGYSEKPPEAPPSAL